MGLNWYENPIEKIKVKLPMIVEVERFPNYYYRLKVGNKLTSHDPNISFQVIEEIIVRPLNIISDILNDFFGLEIWFYAKVKVIPLQQ